MTVLSPLPKSIVISVGTPRNACITSRWSLSVTGDILEQLTDRGRPVDVLFLQQVGKTPGQIGRKLIQRVEQRQKKLLRAWTVHECLLTSAKVGRTKSKSMNNGDLPSNLDPGGFAPADPLTRSLASRFVGSLRSRGSLRCARSRLLLRPQRPAPLRRARPWRA